MKNAGRWAAAFLLALGVSHQPSDARSLLYDVQHSLHGIERNLCANIPSKKCHTARKTKTPAKKPAAESAPAPAPPPTVPVPQPKPVHLKPNVPVPIPQERPANLKVPDAAKAQAAPATPSPPPPAPTPVAKAPTPTPPPAVKPQVPVPPTTPPVVAAPPAAPVPAPADDGCLQALSASGATFSPVRQPGTSAECVIENPVKLISLKTALGLVKLPDQPTVRCAYARTLQDFVSTQVQPLAQSEMQSPIIAMGTGPGFDCRGRNGDSAAKISEHAKGNAVDIVFFTLANKTGVLVKDALNNQVASFAFLRDVRAAACKTFTTVLGPGANPAHAEHFHIDLEQRNGGYRICE